MRAGDLISSLNKTRPILIAGPTGCGKSALAIRIATTPVSYTHLRAHET